MPWCPKCETEYREGILTCADCGSTLVAELINSKNNDDTINHWTRSRVDKLAVKS